MSYSGDISRPHTKDRHGVTKDDWCRTSGGWMRYHIPPLNTNNNERSEDSYGKRTPFCTDSFFEPPSYLPKVSIHLEMISSPQNPILFCQKCHHFWEKFRNDSKGWDFLERISPCKNRTSPVYAGRNCFQKNPIPWNPSQTFLKNDAFSEQNRMGF